MGKYRRTNIKFIFVDVGDKNMLSKISEEKFYILITLFFGFLLAFLIPPFNSPDENSHFKKAYLVSTGHPYSIVENGVSGNYLPDNITLLANINTEFMGNYGSKYSYQNFIMNNHTLEVSNNLAFDAYSTSTINPIAYVVPASGIVLAKVFSKILGIKLTITEMLYTARISSLIVYSLIIYAAIKQIPKFKKSILALALMPMTIALLSCITYDSLLIAITILLFSIIVRLRLTNDKITKKDIISILIIAFIYLNIKYIYSLNLLFLIFIPKNKIIGNKLFSVKKVIPIVCCFIIIYIASNFKIWEVQKQLSPIENTSLQVQFILNNPFEFIKIFFSTLINNRFFYISTFIGVFGLIDTYFPQALYIYYIIFLTLIFICDSNQLKLKPMTRVMLLIIPLAIIGLSFVAMYVNWTSILDGYGVGAKSISGVQGRYFIPAIFSLILVFANSFKSKEFKKVKNLANNCCNYVCLIYLSLTTLLVILRFWI